MLAHFIEMCVGCMYIYACKLSMSMCILRGQKELYQLFCSITFHLILLAGFHIGLGAKLVPNNHQLSACLYLLWSLGYVNTCYAWLFTKVLGISSCTVNTVIESSPQSTKYWTIRETPTHQDNTISTMSRTTILTNDWAISYYSRLLVVPLKRRL